MVDLSSRNDRAVQLSYLHGLLETAIFGGKVDNPYDIRTLQVYLEVLFSKVRGHFDDPMRRKLAGFLVSSCIPFSLGPRTGHPWSGRRQDPSPARHQVDHGPDKQAFPRLPRPHRAAAGQGQPWCVPFTPAIPRAVADPSYVDCLPSPEMYYLDPCNPGCTLAGMFGLPANVDRTLEQNSSQGVLLQLRAMESTLDVSSGFDLTVWGQKLGPIFRAFDAALGA